jgi:hypothetical protein
MLRWRIYYGDGSTFSNEDGSVEQAPSWDIQNIVQIDKNTGRGARHLGGNESHYYVYDKNEDRWYDVDFTGLIDYLINNIKTVKFGRSIDTASYLAIRERAARDFGIKP